MKIKNLLFSMALICSLPIQAQDQLIDDFENGKLNFSSNGGEMGNFQYEVVTNPSKSGINTSEYVLKFKRTVANTPNWGGYWFDLKEEIQSLVKPQEYRYAHVKYYRIDEQSYMKVKIEQSTAGGAAKEMASINAPQKLNKWEDLVFDFEGAVGPYSRMTLMPDFVSDRPAGIEVYIDDIRFNNDPNPLSIFTEMIPQDVTFSELTAISVKLEWVNIGEAVSYTVYNNGIEMKTVTTPFVTLTELTPATEYKITIKANNANCEQSDASAEVIFTTLKAGELAMVTGLVNMDKIKEPTTDSSHPQGWIYRENKYEDKINLEWNAVYNATRYEIYKNGVKVDETTDTKYTINGLQPHTIYYFQVKAVNEEGDSSELTPKLYAQTKETDEQRNERMAWWRDARFGMMITWGVHSAYAGEYNGKRADKHNGEGNYSEWIMFGQNIPVEEYKLKAADFTCENYDPEAWMQAAADAGMKYLVFISKHHDGFALWDSKASDWNALKSSGAQRDVMRPLIEAARKRGIKIGIYYSHSLDWGNKGGLGWMPQINKAPYFGKWDAESQEKYVNEVCIPQIKELLTEYGQVDVFWWDMGVSDLSLEYEQKMLGAIYESGQGDHIILNNRLRFDGSTPGDHETPEQSIPGVPATGYADGHDWETCMTMNDNWGYSKHDTEWKTPADVIRKLIDIVSKGGNFLLNVGPKADGTFPEQSSYILSELHNYMQVNAEAIHGTRACPLENGVPFGRVTSKVEGDRTTLYLHVFDWPADGKLLVPGLYNANAEISLLKDGSSLHYTVEEQGLTIQVPAEAPTTYSSTIKVVVNEPLDMHVAPVVQDEDGTLTLTAETAILQDETGICRETLSDGKVSLGCWKGVPYTQELVQWYTKITKTGSFKVKGEIAAFDSGNFTLSNDNSQSRISFVGTGGWNPENFKLIEMGTFDISQAGLQNINLTTVADGWHPLGLRKLVLEPATMTSLDENQDIPIRIFVKDNKIYCELQVKQDCNVNFFLYNMQGELLYQDRNNYLNAGFHTLSFVPRHSGLLLGKVIVGNKVVAQKVSIK